jgi:hypothetical protein
MGPARRTACIVLFASLSFAQSLDLADLLKHSEAANKANNAKAEFYAYREHMVKVNLNKEGKETDHLSETWDVIGLEGSAYRKLVQRDEKPLPEKEQKREEERLAKETDKRRKETPEQRKNRLFSFTYSVHTAPEAIRLFDVRLLGEETINGRPAYVVEKTPKPDAKPANSNEGELLHYKTKEWIDKEDLVTARSDMEVVRDGSRMKPGTLIQFKSMRNSEGTWLAQETRIRYDIKFFKLMGARGDQLTTMSDYRKFEATSRVVDDAR